jgi:hypothetical protein
VAGGAISACGRHVLVSKLAGLPRDNSMAGVTERIVDGRYMA